MTARNDSQQSQHQGGAPGTDDPAEGATRKPHAPDPQAGLDREVGDLEDPDAEDDGALPGRAGGGLAGA